jgi:c-di-GMP-binding flagellar brake protein YcgR
MLDDKFHVGLKLWLELNNGADKMSMSLVGWDKGTFILAKSTQLKSFKIASDDDCVIRFVKDGVAYGFQTNMLSMQYHPTPLIFLKYPQDIKSMSFRKSSRIKTNIPARFLKEKGSGEFITTDARVVDLSETGCRIEVLEENFEAIELNKSCYLTFLVLDKSIELDSVARNALKKDGKYLLGVEFGALGAGVRETLSSFIAMFNTDEA